MLLPENFNFLVSENLLPRSASNRHSRGSASLAKAIRKSQEAV